MAEELPFVDEHSVVVLAPRTVVWRHLGRALPSPRRGESVLVRVLGARPRTAAGDPRAEGGQVPGFAVAAAVPGERLELVGRHRFSTYALTFTLADAPAGTRLTATTQARFPGPHGAAYRALVIGSRGHRVAVRRMLGAVRRAAEADPT